jgi:glycine dehydrogenase
MPTETAVRPSLALPAVDPFVDRHVGPRGQDLDAMLKTVGVKSLDQLMDETLPKAIRLDRALGLPKALTEHEALARLKSVAAKNKVARSFLGMGYSDCLVPPVIQRNILENPGWYTQYTPYQAEISQGRFSTSRRW